MIGVSRESVAPRASRDARPDDAVVLAGMGAIGVLLITILVVGQVDVWLVLGLVAIGVTTVVVNRVAAPLYQPRAPRVTTGTTKAHALPKVTAGVTIDHALVDGLGQLPDRLLVFEAKRPLAAEFGIQRIRLDVPQIAVHTAADVASVPPTTTTWLVVSQGSNSREARKLIVALTSENMLGAAIVVGPEEAHSAVVDTLRERQVPMRIVQVGS